MLAVLAFLAASQSGVYWRAPFPARALRVGEVVELTLVVAHGADEDFALDVSGVDADRWLVLGVDPPRRSALGGSAESELRLSVAPIAAGAGGVVLDGLRAVRASGGESAVPSLAVPVEDPIPADALAPPPPRGFAAIEAPPAPPPPWYRGRAAASAAGALAAGLVWLVLLLLVRRHLARNRPAPTPRDRVEAALQGFASPDGAERRKALFALVAALRAAVDHAVGVERAALTEEEWLAALAADPARARIAEELGKLFAESADARWAGREPSLYALDGHASRARAVLAELGASPDGGGRRAA